MGPVDRLSTIIPGVEKKDKGRLVGSLSPVEQMDFNSPSLLGVE